MAASLINTGLMKQLSTVGNRRNYEQFVSTIVARANTDSPLRQLLPNAEALDVFKVPTGNVLEISVDSNLVSELVTRQPFESVAMVELSPADVANFMGREAVVQEQFKTFFDRQVAMEAGFMPKYSLKELDTQHWEATFETANISLMRVKGHSNWSGNLLTSGQRLGTRQLQQQTIQKPAVISTFLQSSMREEAPRYSYVLSVSSAVPAYLMEAYATELNKTCQTAGEIVKHPMTAALQKFIERNTNRLMLQVAEHMGWDIPVQVDARSTYNQSAEFSASLMARPDHNQINNGIVAAGNVVQFYNGAVRLEPLQNVVVNLGYDVGTAMFKVSHDITKPCELAVPVSVRQLFLDTGSIAVANPVANVASIVGKDVGNSFRFRSGYFQQVDDQFLSTCQTLCGQSETLDHQHAAAPFIFMPVVTMVGPAVSAR